jgi:hypothetical protein
MDQILIGLFTPEHGLQHTKTTVIFFLGGCTHTEVSAIRFLAQHDESKSRKTFPCVGSQIFSFCDLGRDYLVATTQMINGNTFLEPIIEHSQRPTTENIGASM